MQSVQGGSLRPNATDRPVEPSGPARMMQFSKKKKKSAASRTLAKPALQGYNAGHPMEEDHDPNLQSQPRSIKGPPSIKPTFLPPKPRWNQRRGQPRSMASTSWGGRSYHGGSGDTSSARNSRHENEAFVANSSKWRSGSTYQSTRTNRHPTHLTGSTESLFPRLASSTSKEPITPFMGLYTAQDEDTVRSIKRPLSTEGANSPPNHKRQRIDDGMASWNDVPIDEKQTISVPVEESVVDPAINSDRTANVTNKEQIWDVPFQDERVIIAPDADTYMGPPTLSQEEAGTAVEDSGNGLEETSLGHSSKMESESHLPSPPYPDTSMSSDPPQALVDQNIIVPAQMVTYIGPDASHGLRLNTSVAPLKTPMAVHVKEEPESSPLLPSISPIDVDAPEPSLYEQLGLPTRTSGAYRVPHPPSRGERTEWLARIAEQIRWVRGKDSGLKPLKIGKVFFRSDGVAIDWEIPRDDVDETEMRDNAISRPVQHEIIELDDFMEAGVELLPNPAGTDAAVGAEPMQSAEPIARAASIMPFIPSRTLLNDTPVPSQSALTTIAICFLDRYTRCFDLFSSRSDLSKAYLEDARMSFQFNDLPTEGVCPRAGNPRKQSHLIVDLARRDEARNLLIDSDRNLNHLEYDQREEKSLSIGRQAIERRLTSFEDLVHWPSSTYRDHQFTVQPLHELDCILVRHWGNLYSKKTHKQSSTKSKSKSYPDFDSNSNSNSYQNQNLASRTSPPLDMSDIEGQEERNRGYGTDNNEEQRFLSLQFDRTFILKPNSVKDPSWIDWPWVISNEQLTVFHRPGIVCQCLP